MWHSRRKFIGTESQFMGQWAISNFMFGGWNETGSRDL